LRTQGAALASLGGRIHCLRLVEKLRERVECNDGAPTAPAGAERKLNDVDVDTPADKGSKRVLVDSTDKSSTQV